jgi:hypothetical protein
MLLARVLVVLGALLAVLALLAGYIRFQALDTDTVENTAGELIADPEIRNQVAARLVDELFANVDVEAALREQLPADQKGLAAPIASALQLGAEPTAQRLLARPRVQELWVRSISTSHEQLIQLLEGDEGALRASGGNVVLDLRPLVVQLGDRIAIVGRISERLPPDTGLITIVEADNLETAQDLTQLLKVLGMWLWLVPIALWAVALWLARGRRRAILRMIAFSSIIAGLLVLVVRRVAGSTVVDELAPAESVKEAAGDAWDILTSQLRDGGLTLLGIGVILLFAVWIAGPSRRATAARRWLAPYIARPEIAFGAAAVLLLLLVWWGPVVQTERWQFVVAIAAVLALGVEVLRRQTAREFPELVPVAEEDEGVVKKQ